MPDCRSRMKIHQKLVPVKAAYFFTLAGVGSLLPYLSVYMKQVGLSASESAIIYGVMPFLGALVKPLLGAMADKLQQYKAFLMLCCVFTGVLHGSLLFVPHAHHEIDAYVNVSCVEKEFSSSGYYTIEGCHTSRLNCSEMVSSDNNESCVLSCIPYVGRSSCENGTVCKHSKLDFNVSETEIFESVCLNLSLPSVKGICPSEKFHCSLKCMDDNTLVDKIVCQEEPQGLQKYSSVFLMYFVVYLFAQIAFSPIFNLIDAMTYDYLGDERDKWGQQRLWGTVGYAVFAVISTLYQDVFASAGKKNYTAAFILFAVNNVIAAGCVCFFQISNDVSCSNMAKNLMSVLKIPRLTCLLVIVFIFGMYQGLVETFVFWHLHTLGSSQLLFGLSTVMNCIPEILILSISGRILRLLGHIPTMSLVFVAWFVRLLSYSFLSNPWWVLAIEPLHSVTFGLMYAGASSYGSKVAPPGMHGTIQGLLSGLHFGFGKGVGSVTSGQVFEHFGSVVMFQSYAVSALVALVMFLLTSLLIRKFCHTIHDETKENGEMIHAVPSGEEMKEEKEKEAEEEDAMLNGQSV